MLEIILDRNDAVLFFIGSACSLVSFFIFGMGYGFYKCNIELKKLKEDIKEWKLKQQ